MSLDKDGYARFSQYGEAFTFFVENTSDLIQSRHASGKLYEIEELDIIRSYAPADAVFYDIGANVGNHTIFMGNVLKARRIYPFEANARAAAILKRNIIANGLDHVIDGQYLGIGVGVDGATLHVFNPQENNLGAARLKRKRADEDEGYFGAVEIRSIDALHIPDAPDFVKIDVEGMEIQVLQGMSEAIANSRPAIFIEVNNVNLGSFSSWASENSYVIKEEFTRYKSSVNFMAVSV